MTRTTINTETRAGRMLAAGTVTITVYSKASGKHVTVKADCCRKESDGSWERVPFAEASHVFINSKHQGSRIGTYYPRSGDFYTVRSGVDTALEWAARAALRFALTGEEHPQADFAESDHCGCCGRALTDPVSLDRGIGPDCYGKLTGSIAYTPKAEQPADTGRAANPGIPGIERVPSEAVRQAIVALDDSVAAFPDADHTPAVNLAAAYRRELERRGEEVVTVA